MGMTTDVHVRDLRSFLTVAEELHFTRAAERLYVSQPALSKQVRALERQLGVELFHRDRQGVALTGAGAALLPHARRVLAAWEEGAAAVERTRAAQRSTLVVGMSTSPGRGGLLPAVRSRFTAAHPEAVVRLRQVSWEDPTAGLADGEADVAFVWLPLPDPERYAWTVVAEEPRLVALPDTHPLAARAELTLADLADEPFLALPPSAGVLRDHWLALDERPGGPPRVGAEIAGTEETYEALVAGLGICFVATGNAPLVTLGGVTTRPVRDLSPSRYALAWRKRDAGRPLVRGYAEACRRATRRGRRAAAVSRSDLPAGEGLRRSSVSS
ncbi:LysR family transcriptional regulator [Streptomyces griseomycini]|uniref:LysR family transcriptional regulator n=1 Tax=Streptomyces griseomycini TaxID=66895 RepID=UPI00187687E7|nr:LysR family transcriptional regulator [Streptomyces griseomycini]GGP93305.1 LysR family transcriptional regulator [Streptomyces griseomycini]